MLANFLFCCCCHSYRHRLRRRKRYRPISFSRIKHRARVPGCVNFSNCVRTIVANRIGHLGHLDVWSIWLLFSGFPVVGFGCINYRFWVRIYRHLVWLTSIDLTDFFTIIPDEAKTERIIDRQLPETFTPPPPPPPPPPYSRSNEGRWTRCCMWIVNWLTLSCLCGGFYKFTVTQLKAEMITTSGGTSP